MKVEALILNVTNWKVLNDTCAEISQINPLRDVISAGYRKEDACAFMGALPLGRAPITNLSDLSNPFYIHHFFGYLITVSNEELEHVLPFPPQCSIICRNTTSVVLIATGTLQDWISRIYAYSKPTSHATSRLVANKCLELLRSMGIQVWQKRMDQDDGTFTMELKSR